ncbi:MAG: DUF4292 domain-containing protein [Deltaproteobacteria bacterium]|nr:DUF4292 domain-containing protein [Deltaproteobacteria bacterium]
MKKRGWGKIRVFKLLSYFLGLMLILPVTALGSIQGLSTPLNTDPLEINDSRFQTLIDRLAILNEPVSREGKGVFIAQAPGERYRLQFRLIARGPEACRLEIFDPFGRPMLYLVSYQGESRLFSIAQKKEIPFNPSLLGPWSSMVQIPIVEMLKIFWGRVPLLPYKTHQIDTVREEGKSFIKLALQGSVQQELWITPLPFSLTKSRLRSPSQEGEWEIIFSDFSEAAGNRLPMRCEIKEGTGEHALTIRYESLVPRADIPDEIFKLSNFSEPKPAEK